MTANETKRLHALVSGRVQGVGFRYFVRQSAAALDLSGWVRNLFDGRVELAAEGEQASLEALLARVRQGPPGSHVDAVDSNWWDARGENEGFRVRGTAAGPES